MLALGVSVPAAWLAVRRAGAQGLGRFTEPAAPGCSNSRKPTPAADDPSHFKSGAPATAVFDDPGVSGRRLTLTGAVIGVRCGVIKNARVEFWQARADGHYDADSLRLRGYQLTDAKGLYSLRTIVPGAEAGRAPHLNARVTPPGKPALSTAVYFPGDPANGKDRLFHDELLLTWRDEKAGTATFDFILDL